jgi:vesicle-associated membrane protein 7
MAFITFTESLSERVNLLDTHCILHFCFHRNFAFLQAIEKDFMALYTPRKIKNANAYAFDKTFSSTVRSVMHYYNTNHKTLSRDQKVEQLKAQVEDMKNLMGRNVNLLLEREVHLNRLMDKANELKEDSMVFKRRSIKLKRQVRGRYWKIYMLSIGLALAIIYTIAASACGVTLQHCRGSSDGGDD